MKRLLAVLLVAALLVPPASAQSEVVPGEYPEPVRESLDGLLGDAEQRDVVPQDSLEYLEKAREHLEAGNASLAIENYVFYRVTDKEQALAERLEGESASDGQALVDKRLGMIAEQAQQTSDLARETLRGIQLGNLTQRGLDTALWGAILVARGELQLGLHDAEIEPSVYSNGELDRNALGERVAALYGGLVTITLGLEIASQADRVDGEPLDPETAHQRLSQAANTSLRAPPDGAPEYLPQPERGDGPLFRTAILHVSFVELQLPQFYQMFGTGSDAQTLKAMENALRFDREKLGPYADAGFPLAQSSFEGVAFLSPDQLGDPARDAPQRAHAKALATSRIHETVFPNATGESSSDDVPGLSVLGGVAGLLGAALWARRRR
jgi:PGF-CTERM protein